MLSVGAVALAVVLAVPLFGALGDRGNGDDLRAIDEQTTTTVVTTAAPASTAADVVVVTAAVDGAPVGDTDGASNVDRRRRVVERRRRPEPSDAAPATAAPALTASPDCANQYTAAAGDYWVRIADGSGTSLDSLLDVNEATAETPIYPGSTICLPDDAAAPAAFATLRDTDSSDSTADAGDPGAGVRQPLRVRRR